MKELICKLLISVIIIAGMFIRAEDEKKSVLKNGSFETAGKDINQAKNWQGSSRTSVQSRNGKFSYLIEADGSSEKYVGVSQKLDLNELGDVAALEISAYIFIESYESGNVIPIYFIVKFEQAKTSYLRISADTEAMPFNFWYKVEGKIKLTKLKRNKGKIKGISFMVLGAKAKGKPFKGKFYIDDIKILACR